MALNQRREGITGRRKPSKGQKFGILANGNFIPLIYNQLQKKQKLETKLMSNYDKILSKFTQLGYNDQYYFQELEIRKVMDILCQKATSTRFDTDIAEELWEHSEKNSSNKVQLKNYVASIIEAQEILEEEIEKVQLKMKDQSSPKQEHLEEEMMNLLQDHKFITKPFGLKPIVKDQLFEKKDQIQQSSKPRNLWHLKSAFFITVFTLFFQFILLCHKHHFFNSVILFAILAIFFLNYFNQNYVRFLLAALAISVLLDIIWMIVMKQHYWEPTSETQHSTLNPGFLGFIFVMTAILFIPKILLALIFVRFRNIDNDFKGSFQIGPQKFVISSNNRHNLLKPFLDEVFRRF